jgi:murein L,D-transpeptidase YafK
MWWLSAAFAAEPCDALRLDLPADDRFVHGAVVVDKSDRRIGFVRGDDVVGCWAIGLGAGAVAGAMERRGYQRTAVGWYRTSEMPWSRFYGALALAYPNEDDAHRGLAADRITRSEHDAIVAAVRRGSGPSQATALGGDILVHGGGSGSDWTLGCIALDDADLDALRALLPADRRSWIYIRP